MEDKLPIQMSSKCDVWISANKYSKKCILIWQYLSFIWLYLKENIQNFYHKILNLQIASKLLLKKQIKFFLFFMWNNAEKKLTKIILYNCKT